MRSSRSASSAGLLIAALLASPAPAAGQNTGEETWTGRVVSTTSRWARGRTAIVTESVLRTASGQDVTVRQLGGSVDGIGMVVLHGESVLRTGDLVTATVRPTRDLRGRVSRQVRALYQAGSGGAIPFVRTEATKTRAPLEWASGCALISFHEAGTTHIEGDLEFDVMRDVLTYWRSEVQDCSYFDPRDAGLVPAESEVGLDGINMVIFREQTWCRPATEEDPEECYAANAAALTTLFFIDDDGSSRNGTILDADIEMNGAEMTNGNRFAIAVDHQTTLEDFDCESDLANTFTHEVGHLMGLDHTCWGAGPRLNDHTGEPLPDCDESLSDEVLATTMFPSQQCGETKKATVEADDVAGICGIYPIEEDPQECVAAELDPGGGCRASHAPGPAVLVILAALALLLRRRR